MKKLNFRPIDPKSSLIIILLTLLFINLMNIDVEKGNLGLITFFIDVPVETLKAYYDEFFYGPLFGLFFLFRYVTEQDFGMEQRSEDFNNSDDLSAEGFDQENQDRAVIITVMVMLPILFTAFYFVIL